MFNEFVRLWEDLANLDPVKGFIIAIILSPFAIGPIIAILQMPKEK